MPAATLARSVLLEARRGGAVAPRRRARDRPRAAAFAQVALTETAALQPAPLAAVLRACAVFLVAAQVTAGTLREIEDKGPSSCSRCLRAARIIWGASHSSPAALLWLPGLLSGVTFWAPPLQVALWGLSLAWRPR